MLMRVFWFPYSHYLFYNPRYTINLKIIKHFLQVFCIISHLFKRIIHSSPNSVREKIAAYAVQIYFSEPPPFTHNIVVYISFATCCYSSGSYNKWKSLCLHCEYKRTRDYIVIEDHRTKCSRLAPEWIPFLLHTWHIRLYYIQV